MKQEHRVGYWKACVWTKVRSVTDVSTYRQIECTNQTVLDADTKLRFCPFCDCIIMRKDRKELVLPKRIDVGSILVENGLPDAPYAYKIARLVNKWIKEQNTEFQP